jgi:hypothetical protein
MPAIHCQVLEVPAKAPFASHRERPRDLLPWADPYIAVLMERLENRYGKSAAGYAPVESPSEADECWSPPDDYDWQDDAFRPEQPANSRLSWDPPVYGGWPLLDDQ